MNGGVGAAPPAAAAGAPPGHSRPPLPRRPPGAHRSLKQREREAPDVDWARALQHFAGCIRADLDDLHRRFLEENVVGFAAWKRLWRDARMSAAFHVEFWESTPTTTHKAILQQALDALVWCIEERGGEFGSEADVAALIGRVFALYCAYSVQLGAPKHKIDVDPQDWTALISVNCVMSGAGATMFPTAAREVRAMMHRLVVQDNAFLRCLKGFGPSVRVQDRAERPRGGGETGARQDVPSVVNSATEEDAIVQQSKLEQLKCLNDRYQEIMSRARSSGAAASSSGARLGGRRPPKLPGPLLQGSGHNGEELIRSLTSYMEYKQKEEARRMDRGARAAAAREEEAKNMLEAFASERDDSTNILALSDRGSVMSAPFSPVARSVASSRREPRRRIDSEGSEAFLAELESELHADVSSDQVAPISTLPTRNASTGRHSSAISEISEADSDALADLERELEQTLANPTSPARRKRGRSAPSAGIVSRTATRTVQASKQKSAAVASIEHARPMTGRRPHDSTPSRIPVTDSWAASSTAESDGLDTIQAELDAVPMGNSNESLIDRVRKQ
ncbi:hypothetical protein PHYSODRAFT_314443 [Phytophthora sojae]|uniref:Uncharacterized protein n=1 Tax=Phytophthora sojae (strain P6497) TaxID=1094619 RepID=G4ZHU3_PHYSP|nr:hypothetical protein PHYSODRAFT_314443 [Phytophthora sojae]EGZ16788.1 hypothetical protein PHYSODRAFT_314443 [Phytophthora sojae]|eukprot:XP_009525846.1 hypothetical protein PHYSODRAFT_314443 [Phytophthora sojae]